MDESLSRFLIGTLVLFCVCVIVGAFLQYITIKLGHKFSLYAKPSKRRLSNAPIPRVAGITFSMLMPVFILLGTSLVFPPLVWIGFLSIVVVGLLDDVFEIHALWQTVGLSVGIAVAISGGITVKELAFFDGGYFYLPFFAGAILTFIWFFLVINSINWFDGMDGLAGGVSVMAVAFMALLSLKIGQFETTQGLVVLMALLLAFLLFNLPPAKVYLGSLGVYFIGFWIALFAIQGGSKIATTALVLLPPIVDAIITILRRFLQKKPIYIADAGHGFHTLLKVGIPQKKVLAVYYAMTLLLGLLSYFANTSSKLVIIVLFIVITGSTTLWLQLKYHKE